MSEQHDPAAEGAPQGFTLTRQQRVENVEYLVLRMFMNMTEMPAPEPSAIITVETPPPAEQQAAQPVPYDMAFAREGVNQILQQVEGQAWVPGLLHAARAGVDHFNAEAAKQGENPLG